MSIILPTSPDVEKFYPELSAEFTKLLATIAGRKIAVIGHARPDGDCIGSQVALARVLAARGHDVICVNPDPVPRRLRHRRLKSREATPWTLRL